MVAADRIAIMNRGRLAQVGTPSEIYEQPASPFVASFVGQTNTLEALLVEPGVVEFGGVRLRVRQDARTATPGPVTICVRPHEVRLGTAGEHDAGYRGDGWNCLTGRVVRQTYLGGARDYLIAVGEARLRVSTHPVDDHAVGSEVRLDLPVEACRVVMGD
jgi:ABC-type Fe3+/spermidine/putrescine transport system ATPase subunit